jgi:protein TonB
MAWAETSRGISAISDSDIWEPRDKIGGPVTAAALLHVFVIGGLLLYTAIFENSGSNWGGDSEGTIAVNMVSSASIPLPARPANPENVVASESQALNQSVPAQPTKTEDATAIPIQEKTAKPRPTVQAMVHPQVAPTPVQMARNNDVPFGERGPSNLNATMVKTAAGTGSLKVGQGDFGSRYAWYVEAVRRKISQNWLETEIGPSVSAANRVYLVFDIQRDGSPDHVQVETSSGVPTLDQSALRALQRIDTFGPLPQDYNGSRVSVEFYFDYNKK